MNPPDSEFIDQLKARYRKEAIRAVEEAEQRGFDSGKQKCQEALKAAEDESKKWKAIATALGTGDGEGEPSSLMIKYIMEQVYRDVKKEWSGEDGSDEAVEKIKVFRFSVYSVCLLTLQHKFSMF